MTPTQAVMAALDEMTSLYGQCVMGDEDWADAFFAALPEGWRLCGPDDVTVTSVTDWEALRMSRHWPTPMHMRHAADALDGLVIPKYGDVLRYVADLCDAALSADTDGRERAESITTPAERYAGIADRPREDGA